MEEGVYIRIGEFLFRFQLFRLISFSTTLSIHGLNKTDHKDRHGNG